MPQRFRISHTKFKRRANSLSSGSSELDILSYSMKFLLQRVLSGSFKNDPLVSDVVKIECGSIEGIERIDRMVLESIQLR